MSVAATLHEFWAGDVLTVSDVMDRTGLTRATVHSVCNELVERGWVHELSSETGSSRRHGRPARRFELAGDAGWVLGLDVSEVRLGVIVADLAGRTLFEERFELPYVLDAGARSEHLLASVEHSLRRAEITRDRLLVVSVGVPTPISRDSDVIGMLEPIESTTELWRGIRGDIDLLRASFGDITVLFANDANLALLGERWRGAAIGVEDLIVLLGNEENIGGAVMDAGRLLFGRSGGAGEMYWLDGSAVADVGTDSIARLAQRWLRQEADGAGASRGPADDAAAVQRVAVRIATTIAPCIRIISVFLNPELVVLSGTASQWRDAIAPILAEVVAVDVHDPPLIASSPLGEAVVAVGAVWKALDHVRQHALSTEPANRRPAADGAALDPYPSR